MRAWWRKEPLDKKESALLELLMKAHYQSAFRANTSSVLVANCADSSGDISKSFCAAVMSMGGKHAPLEATVHFLSYKDPCQLVPMMLKEGQKIPGWGGTFQKGQPDQLWHEVDMFLWEHFGEMATRIADVTDELDRHLEERIHPNPSAYTAASAILVGMKAKLVPYLFIASRLDAWAQIAAEHIYPEGSD